MFFFSTSHISLLTKKFHLKNIAQSSHQSSTLNEVPPVEIEQTGNVFLLYFYYLKINRFIIDIAQSSHPLSTLNEVPTSENQETGNFFSFFPLLF